MAEPLKKQFGVDVPSAIASMILAVHPTFNSEGFVRDTLLGYEALGLMARGKKIAQALREHLPPDYAQAVAILMESLDQPHGRDRSESLASFIYLPHTVFVSEYGLAHVETSMQVLHALTQRFTGEFAIRAFIAQHPEATLRQLAVWANDPSAPVRRLVSEGIRPRLPWAARLRLFHLAAARHAPGLFGMPCGLPSSGGRAARWKRSGLGTWPRGASPMPGFHPAWPCLGAACILRLRSSVPRSGLMRHPNGCWWIFACTMSRPMVRRAPRYSNLEPLSWPLVRPWFCLKKSHWRR